MNTIFYIYRVTSQTVNQGQRQERERARTKETKNYV